MKLIYYIIFRISIVLILILTVWAAFFYVTMIDEINDEVDDYLLKIMVLIINIIWQK